MSSFNNKLILCNYANVNFLNLMNLAILPVKHKIVAIIYDIIKYSYPKRFVIFIYQ